ncbi:hypothetical protein [Kitasatospora paranensis]|uniref:DUF3592 domain-containing protein n=1 Tax=Kitasatospora paranensis TaxID=258053 RepID=A0ABW2FR19_9ACTN
MISSFLAMVVFPLVTAVMIRWAAARRRRGLTAGRAVHFRCRLDGRRGRLLADPRLDGPVFLDRSGRATAVPRGGTALDATVATRAHATFEKVGLRYRTPEGRLVSLGLGTHDARTLGSWLAEHPRPATGAARRLPVPSAPLWAVLALTGALFVGLAAVDVALLGQHTNAEIVQVNRDDDSCAVRWDGGAQQATVDCDTATARPGSRIPLIAVPWPFLGEAVDTRTTPTVAAVLGGGLGLLGLGGALVVNPLACARRVRLARRPGAADPVILPPELRGGAVHEDEWPPLEHDLSYANLAAAALHGDRHRAGFGVTPPRPRRSGTSVPPSGWALFTLLGTGAWLPLVACTAGILDDRFHLGHWRYPVLGTIGVAALARIGWFVTDRSGLCGPVLRAARAGAGSPENGDASGGEWRPMRYVRLFRSPGEMVLVLFRSENGEVAAPLYVQQIARSGGRKRRTVGGPAPVGEALVHDTGVGPLVCQIDGVRYLPIGRAVEAAADPARTRRHLLDIAGSHRRAIGRT